MGGTANEDWHNKKRGNRMIGTTKGGGGERDD